MPPRPTHDERFSAPTRLVAGGVARWLFAPGMTLLDRLGYAEPVWRKILERMRRDLATRDFGAYRPDAHDVVVCTFPKCGTNWAMQIAYQITTRGGGDYEGIHDVIPWPDWARQEFVVSLDDPGPRNASSTGLRVIKTHHPWERIPYTEDARYLCVLRDPKDALVSLYHFMRDTFFGPAMPPVHLFVELFCEGSLPFVWSTQTAGYWRERNRENVLVLRFEEMKADPDGAVGRIAHWMGVELSAAEHAAVCERSSFVFMQGIDHKLRPPELTPLASPDRKMVRRGASGGSSELLSPAQQRLVDERVRSDLERVGSDFPYDEVYGNPAFLA